MLTRLWALIVKELLNILRDPKSRTVLLVPPVIQIFIFSFAMTMEVKNVPLGILNLDAGREGYELVARFRSAATFTRIVPVQSEAQIPSMLDAQQALAVLVVPLDFSAAWPPAVTPPFNCSWTAARPTRPRS
jgi:ABC-2 type transport system permease protein